MSENQTPTILQQIIDISKLDVLIAGLEAQKKLIENDVAGRNQAIVTQQTRAAARTKVLEDKKALVAREEKAIKLERERINDRRRSLGTLNNYKVQQAAEREIDFVSKQVGQREEMLLSVMREVEMIEKELTDLSSSVNGLKEELVAFEKDSSASLATIVERLAEYNAERNADIKAIGPNPHLVAYNRIRNRYPMDPVVSILGRDSCSGCHMKLGPQAFVQVSRGDIVKCAGCGRILRAEGEASAGKS